ncbi:MAG: hypothetical protein IPH35_09005 [Rhodoferax sp.]|nr:hypothetical protein [Rhodoferax sp.]
MVWLLLFQTTVIIDHVVCQLRGSGTRTEELGEYEIWRENMKKCMAVKGHKIKQEAIMANEKEIQNIADELITNTYNSPIIDYTNKSAFRLVSQLCIWMYTIGIKPFLSEVPLQNRSGTLSKWVCPRLTSQANFSFVINVGTPK